MTTLYLPLYILLYQSRQYKKRKNKLAKKLNYATYLIKLEIHHFLVIVAFQKYFIRNQEFCLQAEILREQREENVI